MKKLFAVVVAGVCALRGIALADPPTGEAPSGVPAATMPIGQPASMRDTDDDDDMPAVPLPPLTEPGGSTRPRRDRLAPVQPPRVTAINVPDPNDDPGAEDHEDPHYITALILGGIVIVVPSIYYWSTQGAQSVDWTLAWNKADWKQKLVTFDAVRWDTNAFNVNTVRHPLVGVLQYQIGRANGIGMLGSTGLAFFLGAYWEYFVEYKENPALNDILMNTIGGMSIGEPLYQIGQAWRGGTMSVADRLRGSLFSPFDAVHDLIHHQPDWHRPRYAHRSIFAIGVDAARFPDASTRHETSLRADIDAVNHGNFTRTGARSADVRPGAWSRVAAEMRFGDLNGSTSRVDTSFRSSTTFAGHYSQDDQGRGVLAAIGTAFTYDRVRLDHEWDRVAIGHLAGPQIQLSLRRPGLAVRFDAAAYADFGLIQAHVFGLGNPFQGRPDLYSTLQAEGYYDAWGGSATARMRVDSGSWSFDLEAQHHQLYQINGRDRVAPTVLATKGYTPEQIELLVPHGTEDARTYWRTAVDYHLARSAWGAALTLDGATRTGSWKTLTRETSTISVGLAITVDVDSLRGVRVPL